MKKILFALSFAAVMFVAMFAATPQVAHAFDADVIVQSIVLHPENDTIDLELKFINNEDRPLQFWGVDVKAMDIYHNDNGKYVFLSGSFTINVDSKGDFIVPAHSEKSWYTTIDRNVAPNMDKIPNIKYDWNAGWRLRWDYFPRVNYAQ